MYLLSSGTHFRFIRGGWRGGGAGEIYRVKFFDVLLEIFLVVFLGKKFIKYLKVSAPERS